MQYTEGSVFDGRYLLKEFKGSGSFGEVWLALDQQTEVEVAVKIYVAMDSHGLSEFKKEFQVSFNLNHTNLLHANFLEVCKEDQRAYLVMPYCPKGSTSKMMGKMTEEQLWLESNKWELSHGGLSGRTAQQFIDYLLGKAEA